MASAVNFFNEQEKHLLVKAITDAELHTSGEIRLHLQNYCWGNELNAARRMFARLKMHQTAERNGVLIYIAVRSRKIAVFGDEGIHQKLGKEFWDKLVKSLIDQFKANNKASSLAECILECGTQLGTYFPRKENDVNELTNDISYK
ncbi:MAG: TPM domain-containing protein [Bacteroidia bacterium]|nr:TPM domain-containing protein [Bacteroidia bacterium]